MIILTPGVQLHVDPEKWTAEGFGIELPDGEYTVQISLTVANAITGQSSELKHIIVLRSA